MSPSPSTITVQLSGTEEASLREKQWSKIQRLFHRVFASENFNSRRLRAAGLQPPPAGVRTMVHAPLPGIHSFADFIAKVPFTTKMDLLADRQAQPPFGTNFTESFENYTRFCQTTGTSTGMPMAVLDTPASWDSMLHCWRQVYRAAKVGVGDRVFFPFSFGPFLGFWTAFEAAARGCLVIPGGGLTSQARLEMIARYAVTVICSTPTYLVRLGEQIGAPSGIHLEQLKVRRLIVAGEPGGCLPTMRDRLSELWGAKVFDHHGMSEVGPVSFEDPEYPSSLCVMEESYFAEVIDEQGHEVEDGSEGELVLTTLDRTACPLLRYRTGDWVCKRLVGDKLFLEGGVLGRVDDMAVIRGVNLYPSAIENVVRRFPEVAEFQVEQRKVDSMDEILVIVELQPDAHESVTERIEERLQDSFALRIPVKLAAQGSLPRFDFKARRWRRM
jgi:phenylacetate-CoA ligase